MEVAVVRDNQETEEAQAAEDRTRNLQRQSVLCRTLVCGPSTFCRSEIGIGKTTRAAVGNISYGILHALTITQPAQRLSPQTRRLMKGASASDAT